MAKETQLICPHHSILLWSADGSSGIGKAVAFAFDANGCSVAILGSGREVHRLDDVVSLNRRTCGQYG